MRENEFEKKVQAKMSELQLGPSDEVWTEVERRIRREKKRRFIFWWPLFAFLAIGTGAGIWFASRNQSKPEQAITKTGLSAPEAANEDMAVTNKTNVVGIVTEKNQPGPVTMDHNTINTDAAPVIQPARKNDVPVSKNKQPYNEPGTKTRKIKDPVPSAIAQKIAEQQNNTVPADNPQPKTGNPGGLTQPPQPVPAITSEPGAAAAIADSTLEKPTVNKDEQKEADSLANKDSVIVKKEPPFRKRWVTGFTLSAGQSSLVSGFNLFASKSLESLMNAPGQGSPSGALQDSSSSLRGGLAFSAGMVLQKPLSKKWDIELGISYTYLSAKLPVGSRVDSSRTFSNAYSGAVTVGDYYRPTGYGQTIHYTNRYHFAGLSAAVSWKLVQGKRLALSWKNGIQFNQLLGSNMLHYDRNVPGYYRDNRLLRKSQLFIQTGLPLHFSNRWSVSPFAAYGITPGLRNNGPQSVHFTMFGIGLQFFPGKK